MSKIKLTRDTLVKIGNLIQLIDWDNKVHYGVVLAKDLEGISVLFTDGQLCKYSWWLTSTVNQIYVLEAS